MKDLVIYWDRPNNGQINSKQRQNTDRNVYIQEMAEVYLIALSTETKRIMDKWRSTTVR